MFSIMLAAAALGTDPSPEGAQAVRDLAAVSAALCAPGFREGDTDVAAVLKVHGFNRQGRGEKSESGSHKLADLQWDRDDERLTLFIHFVDGVMDRCSVHSPLPVWN